MVRPTIIDVAGEPKMAKKNWVKKATSGAHGQFKAKAQAAGESTRQYAEEHKGDSDKTGAQARLALTLMGLPKRKLKYANSGDA